MQFTNSVYRKNVWLISAFLITITVTLIVGLVFSYRFTAGNVLNDFYSKKNDILEKTTAKYSDFFNDKIPTITTYVGYMDSSKAAGYASTTFNDFPFVTRIVFYNIGIGNKTERPKGEIGYEVNDIYQFTLDEDVLITTVKQGKAEMTDLQQMMNKLKRYIAVADTTRDPNDTEKFNTFYDSRPNKISYLNIPRRTDIKSYHEIQKSGRASIMAEQDMMTFFLDPTKLTIVNDHPELYKEVAVKQVVFDPLDNSGDKLSTDAPFPGALSDYKLYFRSDKDYLGKEVRRQFLPAAGIILLIYLFLVLIGWLIFRNLAVNLKMFKLQYDFINNFTHEFKTPVSVIKIAGSNIRGEADLTERQRKHYGKILDEEADKLNDLMNKLLSFTQIENRSIKIKVEEIDVDEFVSKYINTFKIKYPDLDLKCTIGKGVNTFFTDPVLLGSIFQNLIENAYKYSNPDRKEVLISILLEKRNIVFSFADKGIGIPKAELANVFKKFYRIENKYNQNGSVGLGLAFVKELVNFMDGQITVKSKVNEGSEFVVSLPYEN